MMDPQQRILIQGVFEAIEDGGLTLEDIQSVNTGVYVGNMNQDYSANLNLSDKFERNQFTGTGTSSAIIANRISFALNLKGPSVTMDTACSSSSTALSFAYEHLKSGKCDIAIVGASNVIVDKDRHMIICQAKMLAPDGQSKAFDARGDGYGRGEGMVVVILKLNPVSNTRNQNAYCNILACNVNNDGQSAIPITAPSVEGQSRLFQMTCMEAGIKPESVSYLEAHGTGTVVGDRVETQSISQAYCSNRPSMDPLRVGSVKSNINHTESVAGLAGLAKVCLMMEHKQFVPTVGIMELNPDLDLERRGLQVQQKCEEWPDDPKGRPRTAAVNSFGFGGSNAHMIVQECKKDDSESALQYYNSAFERDDPEFFVLVLSARTRSALQQQAKLLSTWILDRNITPSLTLDLCYSLSDRRTKHNFRMALALNDLRDSIIDLKLFSSDDASVNTNPAISSDRVRHSSPLIGFAFGGQGSEIAGIVESLCEYHSLRSTCELVDQAIRDSSISRALLQEIRGLSGETSPSLDNESEKNLSELTRHQLTIFKIQYAIATLLMDNCGITPTAVLGHSLGDITAACVAGCISLSNAVDLIIVRAELQHLCRIDGQMVAVGLNSKEMMKILGKLKLGEAVDIAAINDDQNITISGDSGGLASIEAYLTGQGDGVFWRKLKTAKAYHSHHMSSIEKMFLKYVEKIKFKSSWSSVQFISSVHAKLMNGSDTGGLYWWQNVRFPVDFNGAMKELFNLGCSVVIEISASTVLQNYLKNISQGYSVEAQGHVIDILSAMPRPKVKEKVKHLLAHCIGQLFNIGCRVNFSTLMDFSVAKFVRYPTYAWQETSFWFREPDVNEERKSHLLGEVEATNKDYSKCFRSEIDVFKQPFLADHNLKDIGTAFPGAGYIEIMLKAALGSRELKSLVIEHVTFDNILTLPENVVKMLRTLVNEKEAGKLDVKVMEIIDENEVQLSSAQVRILDNQKKGKALGDLMNSKSEKASPRISYEIMQIQKNAEKVSNADEMHKMIEVVSVYCGDAFSLLDKGWHRKGKFLARMKLPPVVLDDLGVFVLHPAIIDAALQCVVVAIGESNVGSVVPVGIGCLNFFPIEQPFDTFYCIVSNYSSDMGQAKIKLMTEKGEVIMMVKEVKVVDLMNVRPKLSLHNSIYEINVVPGVLDNFASSPINDQFRWIIIGLIEDKIQQSFCEYLQAHTAKSEDVVIINLEKSESAVEIVSEIQSVISTEKENILVNFVPSSLHRSVVALPDVTKANKMVFNYCFKDLGRLLGDDNPNFRVEFVTCEDIHTRQTTADDGIDRSNYPLASMVWGFAKALRLEWPSKSIQCADISRQSSASDLRLLAAHCINDVAEPEVIIRKEKCYFPRFSPLSIEETTNVKFYSSNRLHSIPHYFVLNESEGKVAIIDDNAKLNRKTSFISFKTHFIGDLYGGFKSLQVKNSNTLSLLWQPISCYGGIMHDESKLENVNKEERVIIFQSGHRLYSEVRVESSEVAKVPEWMDLQEAVALAGCLIVASRIMKMMQRCLLRCQKCLIMSGRENQQVAFVTMLTACDAGIDVYTNCLHFDHRMSEAGIHFVSTDDIEDEYNDFFDCVVVFDTSIFQEMVSFESSITQNGCIILIEDVNRDTKAKDLIFASTNRKIPCYTFSSSKISPEGLAEEWSCLLPASREESPLFKILQSVCINTIDPYFKELVLKEADEITFNVLNINHTKCETVPIKKCSMDFLGFKTNRTYVVIGGHKGLGMETSMWLLKNGADHVLTCGRSLLTKELSATYSAIENKSGVFFAHIACDITTLNGIEELRSRLEKLPPLAGIINSAVVYDDRVSQDVDYASFSKVIGPKVIGSLFLHDMVKRMNVRLDFFILFSSIASNVGNVGQASYCAGNFFMNEFANRMSMCEQENYLSICWGPMGDAGYLSQHEDVAKMITEKLGLHIIPIKTGLQWLKTILTNHPVAPTITLNSFDFVKMNNKTNPLKSAANIRHLIPKTDEEDAECGKGPLGILKEFTTTDERWAFISDYLKAWLAKWLGTADMSEVDLNSSLSQYGIDSGGAIGFQSAMEKDFQVTIPVYELLRPDSTGLVLVNKILSQVDFNDARSRESYTANGDNVEVSGPFIKGSVGQGNPEESSEPNPDEEVEPPIDLDNFCAIAHAPSKAQANFFWIHSTHRYRGHMLSVAEGFKSQDIFRIYSIGSEDMFYKATVGESVNSLAEAYIKLIFRIQPRGPFFIGGFSFGGSIAFEIASILREREEIVALLVMVDTFPWISQTFALEQFYMNFVESNRGLESKYFLESFMRSTAIYKLGMDEEIFNEKFSRNSTHALAHYLDGVAQSKEINMPSLELLCEAVEHNISVTLTAMDNWQLPRILYNGPLLFFEARNKRFTPHPPGWERNSFSWRDLIEPREFYTCLVDSDHHSIIQQRNGIEIGKMVSTMSRFVLKRDFPNLSRSEIFAVDNYSIQALSEGFNTTLGSRKKGIHGILKANLQKRRWKFKLNGRSKLKVHQILSLPFNDIINVTKADQNFNAYQVLTTMGVVIWARSKQFEFYFHSWLEYNRFILGLQGVLGIRLHLFQ